MKAKIHTLRYAAPPSRSAPEPSPEADAPSEPRAPAEPRCHAPAESAPVPAEPIPSTIPAPITDLLSPVAHRRRNGKVARLPKEVRDRINQLLDDGLTFRKVLKQLGDQAPGVTVAHIGSWHGGGFQDYLQEERRRDECRLRHQLLKNLAADDAGIETYQASPKIAVALASEALIDLGPETLRRALKENPMSCFRLLNALARVLSGGLKCERHIADLAARALILQAEQPDSEKGLSPKVLKQLVTALNLK